MATVDAEKKLQNRVLHWLVDDLGYTYLGNLEDIDNTPVKEELLKANLKKRGYTDDQIKIAISELVGKVNNQANPREGISFSEVVPMNKQQTEMKEYLSQAFRIDQRIQSKMEQVASLNDLATRATATYSDMPGSETRNLHRMEDAILSIIELEAEINEDICKLVQTKKDIVHKIKAV